jgi:hypothetical protein
MRHCEPSETPLEPVDTDAVQMGAVGRLELVAFEPEQAAERLRIADLGGDFVGQGEHDLALPRRAVGAAGRSPAGLSGGAWIASTAGSRPRSRTAAASGHD